MNEIQTEEEYIKVIPATEAQITSYDKFIDESLKIGSDYENGITSWLTFNNLTNKNYETNFPKFTQEQLDLVPNRMYEYNFPEHDKKLLLLHHSTKLPSYNDGITFLLDKNDIISFYNTNGEKVTHGKVPLSQTSHYNLKAQSNIAVIDDLKITDLQRITFQEKKRVNLTKEQLEKIPDYLQNNKLSEYQKQAFAFGSRIDFINPQADDELQVSFTLKQNGMISAFYPTGEQNLVLKEELSFINNLTLNKNAMSTTAQENPGTEEKKVYSNEITVGDLVSVKTNHGKSILTGIVKETDGTSLTLDTRKEGLVKIQDVKDAYKFFPRQRIDLRELSMPLLKEKTGFKDKDGNETYKTVVSKLNSLLFSKTEYGNFDNWKKENNGDLVALLTGKLIHNNIKGESLLPARDENNNIIKDAPKKLVNWEAKFQIYRGKDDELKIDTIYKERKELSFKLFNKEVSPDEKENLLKGQSVAITRTRNNGEEFKIFARIDKDLNKIVTSPYSEKLEVVMKAAYAKKEGQSTTLPETEKKETIAETPTAKEKFKNSLKEKLEEKEAPKKAKGRRI